MLSRAVELVSLSRCATGAARAEVRPTVTEPAQRPDTMLVQLLTIGAAFRLPTAGPHAARIGPCVTMMAGSEGGTRSYLASTIRAMRTSGSASMSSSDQEDMTRDNEPSVEGMVAPTSTLEPASPPALPSPTQPFYKEYKEYQAWQAQRGKTAPPASEPQLNIGAAVAPSQQPTLTTRAVRVLGPLALASGAIAGTLAFTSLTAPKPITIEEIMTAQREWGDAIVRISKTYLDGGDYVAAAEKAADELYGYGRSDVLFKPTKAAETPFRPTAEGALSYFIGGDKVTGGFAEDKGFALGPGGVGWKKVIFDNNKIDLNGKTAQAMGEYYFYSAADDSVAKVEYTFGYKRNDDGKMRIYLHHSSLPYPGKKKAPAPEAPKA